jgi:cellulose synthase/poly-beta-1,6-N-acetylglucosamine synthase-like glycosyltransferase
VSVVFWVVAAIWLIATLAQVRDLRALHPLPPLPRPLAPAASDRSSPRVSVVIPTRDEGDRLLESLRLMLAQRHVDLELIVVDDRSTDGTFAHLEGLAATNPRVRPLRIDTLPAGWLGKTHACHAGATGAKGEWLLFCDADVWLSAAVIARAVAAAERDGADHLCLLPGESATTLPGQACLLNFSIGLLGQAAGANRDQPWAFVGVGAFTLIRRAAYDTIGGHAALRMEVIEDLKLGYLVRRHGLRTRIYLATDDVHVHWGGSFRGMTRALEKNIFALFDYSVPLAVGFAAALAALTVLPLAGPFAGSAGGWAAAAAMALSVAPRLWMTRRAGWSALAALLSPPAGVLGAWIVLNSARAALREGGVRWRETVYPLARLRETSIPVLAHVFLRRPIQREPPRA